MAKAPKNPEEIIIFVTGGTFDKEYNMLNGELYFKDTHVNDMLVRGRCTLPTTVRTLMMLDSLEITAEDRELIVYNCQKVPQQRIIVTHGTDTMVETAVALAQAGIEEKTIILTGAMIPYTFGTSSDGFFNLGAALAYAQALPAGVYVCMNGRAYDWDEVQKNRQTGFFEEV